MRSAADCVERGSFRKSRLGVRRCFVSNLEGLTVRRAADCIERGSISECVVAFTVGGLVVGCVRLRGSYGASRG